MAMAAISASYARAVGLRPCWRKLAPTRRLHRAAVGSNGNGTKSASAAYGRRARVP